MVLKSMTSIAEPKDIYVQFGATATSFHHYVVIGTKCLVHVLSDDRRAKIYWDRSAESLEKSAKRTSGFMKIPGVVGMLDGMKRATSTPDDRKSQNRDYNGWTGDVNRNVLLLWDPFGEIIDAVVNTPGSYHDSRAALWGEIYNHISTLPKNYKVVCDSAFRCVGELEKFLIKTKYNKNNNSNVNADEGYDTQLTHLRQCSEWGNHVLVDTFRRLHRRLPTENVSRGYIWWVCILFCNFRTETIGRNQIKTYFDHVQKNEINNTTNENESTNNIVSV